MKMVAFDENLLSFYPALIVEGLPVLRSALSVRLNLASTARWTSVIYA